MPYLDSIISSLEARFSEKNKINFSLFSLHPTEMSKMSRDQFQVHAQNIIDEYSIDNFDAESKTWYDMWSNKSLNRQFKITDGMLDLLKDAEYFPAISNAILIALTLPVTTCTVERSFSTLRRVKTWLRSTMADNRLSGLCMMSVHRERINKREKKRKFIHKIIDKFGRDHRRI